MDYNRLNLRGKTVIDFTSDNSIIAQIVGDKDLFLSNLTNEVRALTFLYYAEFINDEKLITAVRTEFATELDASFNE